jgi:hypothetical protein
MNEDTIIIYVPKFMLRWAHKFRVALNPIYSDEHYKTGLVVDLPLKKVEKLLLSWGCEVNHPNQYEYKNQVASGHIYLKNGKQLHIRVKKVKKGLELKGHVEWHGVTHPILHMLYANLDYEKGYKMIKNFLKKSNIVPVLDEGER